MPNHCHNRLWVFGPKDQMNEFMTRLEANKKENGEYQILETFYPCPADLTSTTASFGTAKDEEHQAQMDENIRKYGARDWYQWCINNWGTKWGDYETYLNTEDVGQPYFSFTSAWSPPVDGFVTISDLFPELEFVHYYSEEGMGFYGLAVYKNGAVNDDCRNYEDLPNYLQACEDDRYEDAWEIVSEASDDLLFEAGYGTLLTNLPKAPQGF